MQNPSEKSKCSCSSFLMIGVIWFLFHFTSPAYNDKNLPTVDLVYILACFAAIFTLAYWADRRSSFVGPLSVALAAPLACSLLLRAPSLDLTARFLLRLTMNVFRAARWPLICAFGLKHLAGDRRRGIFAFGYVYFWTVVGSVVANLLFRKFQSLTLPIQFVASLVIVWLVYTVSRQDCEAECHSDEPAISTGRFNHKFIGVLVSVLAAFCNLEFIRTHGRAFIKGLISSAKVLPSPVSITVLFAVLTCSLYARLARKIGAHWILIAGHALSVAFFIAYLTLSKKFTFVLTVVDGLTVMARNLVLLSATAIAYQSFSRHSRARAIATTLWTSNILALYANKRIGEALGGFQDPRIPFLMFAVGGVTVWTLVVIKFAVIDREIFNRQRETTEPVF